MRGDQVHDLIAATITGISIPAAWKAGADDVFAYTNPEAMVSVARDRAFTLTPLGDLLPDRVTRRGAFQSYQPRTLGLELVVAYSLGPNVTTRTLQDANLILDALESPALIQANADLRAVRIVSSDALWIPGGAGGAPKDLRLVWGLLVVYDFRQEDNP